MDNLDDERILSKSHNLKLENMDNINITFICMDFYSFISANVTFQSQLDTLSMALPMLHFNLAKGINTIPPRNTRRYPCSFVISKQKHCSVSFSLSWIVVAIISVFYALLVLFSSYTSNIRREWRRLKLLSHFSTCELNYIPSGIYLVKYSLKYLKYANTLQPAHNMYCYKLE